MSLPPDGTVERWAWDYISSTDPAHKLHPPEIPTEFDPAHGWGAPGSPGRPVGWSLIQHSEKSVSRNAMRAPAVRCRMVHTFLHHELQAAELFARAVLVYPDAPAPLRKGWVGVIRDELRHMTMYEELLSRHGVSFGDHPVRDWFWSRVPAAKSAASFCAVMGMGLEGGNLDHAARFAEWFREAGDAEAARVQALIGEEEIPHVRLGVHWFRRLSERGDFNGWAEALPAPLTPWMMKGRELALDARTRAGMDDEFLGALASSAFVARRAQPEGSAK